MAVARLRAPSSTVALIVGHQERSLLVVYKASPERRKCGEENVEWVEAVRGRSILFIYNTRSVYICRRLAVCYFLERIPRLAHERGGISTAQRCQLEIAEVDVSRPRI